MSDTLELGIAVAPENVLIMLQQIGEGSIDVDGETRKIVFGVSPSNGMPVVLYRGRYAHLSLKAEEFVRVCCMSIDKQLEKEAGNDEGSDGSGGCADQDNEEDTRPQDSEADLEGSTQNREDLDSGSTEGSK